jgi:RIP metalloprotease RseP
VTYALRVLPLGGFVSFPDDDENSPIPADDPDLLRNRPIPQRALVISAGVLANLLLAWLVLVGHTALAGVPGDPDPGVMVMAVQQGEPAEQAGLKPGDHILSIEGLPLGRGESAVKEAVTPVRASPSVPLSLEVEKNGVVRTVELIPEDHQGQGRIGAQLQANFSGNTRAVHGLGEAIRSGSAQFSGLLQRTVSGYGSLFTDFGTTAQQVSGPVKIVEMGAQLSSQGGSGLALFMALISINLAVLNALPLPLLDGGQLAIILLEGVRGRPIPERFQLIVMQSSFLLVVGLSVLLIVRDTSQLSVVQRFIGQ